MPVRGGGPGQDPGDSHDRSRSLEPGELPGRAHGA